MIADYDALLLRVAESNGGLRGIPDYGLPLLFLGIEAILSRSDWLQSDGEPLTSGQWDTLDDWINKTMASLYTNALLGSIQAYPMAITDDNLLFCNGATYQKSDYPDLWQFFNGTVFGLSATEFKVPDLRDRVLRYDSALTSPDTAYGQDDVVIIEANLPPHKHEYFPTGLSYMVNDTAPAVARMRNDPTGTITLSQSNFTQITGSGHPLNNVPQSYQTWFYIVAR